MNNRENKRLKIAVIGGGIAGIASAWLLQQEHDVVIFEAADYLGGHANPVALGNGLKADTGFLIFNNFAYPLFTRFIKKLGVYHRVIRSEMSFSFSDPEKDLYFGVGTGLRPLFFQKRNIYNKKFYKMFGELRDFRKRASADLEYNRLGEITLREYLSGYSDYFRENLVAPTAAAVWSLPSEKIWDFPAETYIRFYDNHRYLRGFGFIRSNWYTFKNSSSAYILAFLQQFNGKVRLNTPVSKVTRYPGRVEVFKARGGSEVFDKVVFATHADTTLKLLAEPSETERRLLSAWTYHKSHAVLHTDPSAMPADRRLWASWNINRVSGKEIVTYYLNRVQAMKTSRDYFLTFSKEMEISPECILRHFEYDHPVYNAAAFATRKELPGLNGYLNSYFCGSYFGYGFHEDALRSAVKVANRFGIEF